MRQLIQILEMGKYGNDVPRPILGRGMILVKNYYSLISPGQREVLYELHKKGLMGKAKARPQQVKQVLIFLKQQVLSKPIGLSSKA